MQSGSGDLAASSEMSEVWRWLYVGSWEEQNPWRRPEMVPAGQSRPRGALNSSTLLPGLGKETMLAAAGRGALP